MQSSVGCYRYLLKNLTIGPLTNCDVKKLKLFCYLFQKLRQTFQHNSSKMFVTVFETILTRSHKLPLCSLLPYTHDSQKTNENQRFSLCSVTGWKSKKKHAFGCCFLMQSGFRKSAPVWDQKVGQTTAGSSCNVARWRGHFLGLMSGL